MKICWTFPLEVFSSVANTINSVFPSVYSLIFFTLVLKILKLTLITCRNPECFFSFCTHHELLLHEKRATTQKYSFLKQHSKSVCVACKWSSSGFVLLLCLSDSVRSHRLKSLTSDPAVIVESLQKSKAGLLEISEDKTKIRRNPNKPLPENNEEYRDTLKHKSIYMVSEWEQ